MGRDQRAADRDRRKAALDVTLIPAIKRLVEQASKVAKCERCPTTERTGTLYTVSAGRKHMLLCAPCMEKAGIEVPTLPLAKMDEV